MADRAILDFLYPPRCPFCDAAVLPKDLICPSCAKKVSPVSGPVCFQCGKPLTNERQEFCADCAKKKRRFTQSRALWIYEKEVKESVYRFKYGDRQEYARAYAAELAARSGNWIKGRRIQAIVPVPLHRNRKRKRGYNQAEVLAKELSVLLDIPARPDLLRRVKDTKPQKTLSDAQRKENLKHAFQAKPFEAPERILLTDDIYTTGCTLDAAADALLRAGAKKIYACCVSIGRDA